MKSKRVVSFGIIFLLFLFGLVSEDVSTVSAGLAGFNLINRQSVDYRSLRDFNYIVYAISAARLVKTDQLSLPRSSIGTVKNMGHIRIPEDGLTLQQAINQVPDGGVIELSGGTYFAPAGGFVISNLNKGFTIRAVPYSTVILDGSGSRDIIRFMNTARNQGGPVVFEGLTFANGLSITDGIAGGVTMHYAEGTFIDCTFLNNSGQQPATGGGGIVVTLDSEAFFVNCLWSGNSGRNFGGGLQVHTQSKVFILSSQFINNRTNLPNHLSTAAGGAIHVGNASLRVANSRFENNQAGYVGGAIYVIGEWNDPVSVPVSELVVVNSTFIDNQASRDASVSFSAPTEAGAIHIENQTLAKIYTSRFITNRAMIGGAVNTYRSTVEIDHSVFQGNQATGTGNGNGFGGAIAAGSNDSASDGSNNRPNASLSVRDSLIQGWYSPVEIVGQAGGGIYVSGDVSRMYGENGASQMGTVAENRAIIDIENVILTNLDVQEADSIPGTGLGGGIVVTLSDLSLNNSLIILSDAVGPNGSAGGGIAILNQSDATVSNTTIARNTAEVFGAGMFVQGSAISISNCNFIDNEISPGVSESIANSYGAAIFTSPDDGRSLPVTGSIANCVISNNIGLPIFDDDREPGPINDVRYNGNVIYSTTFSPSVYTSSIPFQCCKTVAQLNALVISRSGGPTTDKSQVDNTEPGAAPIVGHIISAPSELLSTGAAGDASSPVTYLGYAWSGGAGTLNGAPVNGNADWAIASGIGTHTLAVDGNPFTTIVSSAAEPAATFGANPAVGGDWTLSWSLDTGAYLDMAIDLGVTEVSSSSGSIEVTPISASPYRAYFITEEGGVIEMVQIYREFIPIVMK